MQAQKGKEGGGEEAERKNKGSLERRRNLPQSFFLVSVYGGKNAAIIVIITGVPQGTLMGPSISLY